MASVVVPGFVPAAFARIGRVGPRREHPAEAIECSAASATSLWSESAAARARPAATIQTTDLSPAWQEAMANETWWAWHAMVAWNDRKAGRTLRVLDSPAGAFAFGDSTLQPVSGTEIWRTILRLFPESSDPIPRVAE